MGFGNGPVIAVGVMMGVAALFAGWGLAQLAVSDGGVIQVLQGNHAPVEAPGRPGQKNAGGGSAPQPGGGGTGKQHEKEERQDPAPGRGDEDEPSRSGAAARA
ncbi:hypothetical protein ACIQVK_19190 [Streptomyces sp. NPDC090493]|uniref:hypothetical protein n=1 Tax=Streptomyces sp. NPDC090493 TaxID=3365964 RepID=UPI003803410A